MDDKAYEVACLKYSEEVRWPGVAMNRKPKKKVAPSDDVRYPPIVLAR
jgi:hypothetical protein